MSTSRPVLNSSASWPKSIASYSSLSWTHEVAFSSSRRPSHAASYTSADLLRANKVSAPNSYVCDEDLLLFDDAPSTSTSQASLTDSDECAAPEYHNHFGSQDEYRQRRALQQERRRVAMRAMKSSTTRKTSDAGQATKKAKE